MTVRSAWLINRTATDGQTREDTRLAPVGTMTPTGALTTRTGLIPGGNPCALTSLSAMQGQLSTGRMVVQGTAAQGAYPVAVTSPETVTFADGNATNPRIDLVVVQVYDQLYDSSGQTLTQVRVVPGTPASSPVVPATPAGAIPLWSVRIEAGTSAGTGGIAWSTALTDLRAYTVGLGGIHPGTDVVGAYAGQWRDNAGRLERWSGTAWVALGTWTSYSPSWTGTSTNPAIGAGGVLAGRYCRIGGLCTAAVSFTAGAATTYGTGTWSFGLPLPAAAPAAVDANFGWEGSARAHSSTAWASGTAHVAAGGSSFGIYDNTGVQWSSTKPFVWAAGAAFHLQATVTYEVA